MTQNINAAFNNFMKDSVNLSSDRTSKARSSRDWLIEQINSIESKKENSPKLYKDKNIFFGSFARNTKNGIKWIWFSKINLIKTYI